jgi:hypothetical protein
MSRRAQRDSKWNTSQAQVSRDRGARECKDAIIESLDWRHNLAKWKNTYSYLFRYGLVSFLIMRPIYSCIYVYCMVNILPISHVGECVGQK